jgi:hypothetical protein
MRKKLAARVTRARARRRRDPFERLALAFADYLKTVGWQTVVVGNVKVSVAAQDVTRITPGAFGRYEAVIKFTGGKFERKP